MELPSEYLSGETYKEIEKDLEYLIKKKRKKISKRLEESSALGDISENAEYQEAKEEQLMNEKHILDLEDLLSRAVVVSKTNKKRFCIEIGCFIVLKKKETGEICKYQIVGSGESNPVEKKISNESPLGQALLGQKKNVKIEVLTPTGKMSYTIMEIL